MAKRDPARATCKCGLVLEIGMAVNPATGNKEVALAHDEPHCQWFADAHSDDVLALFGVTHIVVCP